MKKLTIFLIVLALATPVLADDESPPTWAGQSGWFSIIWDFYGEEGLPSCYVYRPALAEPSFAWDDCYTGVDWDTEAGTLTMTAEESEVRLYATAPTGAGGSFTSRIQITHDTGDEAYGFAETWTDTDCVGGEYMGGEENFTPDAQIPIGDGKTVSIFDYTVTDLDDLVAVLVGLEGGPIYQVVFDVVVHSGAEPGSGDGSRCSLGPSYQATDPEPRNGEDDVDPMLTDLGGKLWWTPPPHRQEADPIPLKYRVYFGTDPCIPGNSSQVTEANFVDVASFGGISLPLDFNQPYHWRVDSNDPNGGGALPNPDAVLTEGKPWLFTTWAATPLILTEPNDALVKAGDPASFICESGGNLAGTHTYTWYASADTVQEADNSTDLIVKGPTPQPLGSDTYTDDNVLKDDEAYYYCKVTNAVGDAFSRSAKLITKRLLARYKLDGDILDATTGGHSPHAATTPYEPNWVPGIVDDSDPGAIELDGSDDYVDVNIPNTTGVGPLPQVTVSMWVEPNAISGEDSLIHDDGETTGDVHFVLMSDTIALWVAAGHEVEAEVEVPLSEWTHLAFVYDNDPQEPLARLYVNGELAGEAEEPDDDAVPVNLAEFSIGAWDNQNVGATEIWRDFKGNIDDVRIYSYALNNVQVCSLYNDVTDEPCCSDYPELDFNEDCEVDEGDLREVVGIWLECNLVYSGGSAAGCIEPVLPEW